MSRARVMTAAVCLIAAALIATPVGLAASPQAIYRDYADNGRLDGTYSSGDLQRALSDAAVQAYGHDKQKGLKPAVETSASAPPPSTSGLPFTGLDLSLIVVGALGLMLLGGSLRRFARQRS